MKRLLFCCLLVVIALLVCLWRLPASVALALLPAQAASVLRVHQLDGTIWSGSAKFSVQHVPPTLSLDWTCRPALAPVGLSCELRDAVSGRLGASVLDRSLTAQQLTVSLPVQIQAGGVALGGSPRVAATVSELLLSPNQFALKAVARVDDATWRFGQSELRLGELSVDCVPATDRASTHCALSNRGGDARLDGKATLSTQRIGGSVELAPANGPVQRFAF